MEIYEGNDEYIFISYAHHDSATVVPILEHMLNAGFRLWYDQGIQAGTEWPAYIEDHLTRCSRLVVFMTNATVESVNCRNEINLASMLKKEILVVYLEETTLAYGLNLQLNSKQSLFRYRHTSDETFLAELCRAQILRCCKEGAEKEEPTFQPKRPTPQPQPRPTFDPNSKERKETILARANGEYMISRIGTKGAKRPEPWSDGDYTQSISLSRFVAVQFHCILLTPQEKAAKRQIGLRIYNEQDRLVYDHQTTISFAPGNDKFSVGWVIRDELSPAQAPGSYTAVIWIDDSRAMEHSFRLVQDQPSGNSFGNLFGNGFGNKGGNRSGSTPGGMQGFDPVSPYGNPQEVAELTKKLAYPKILGHHILNIFLFSLLIAFAVSEILFPTLLALGVFLVSTVLYWNKVRRDLGHNPIIAFFLTTILSVYFGIYLIYRTLIDYPHRKQWKARLDQIKR